ncbi:MAG: FtsW/RodA/SpoVE family cell cycle protein [candidate division WOR-3 bacterium]
MQSTILPNRFLKSADKPRQPVDTILLLATLTLVTIGVIMVYSSTLYEGDRYLRWEMLRVAIGVAALFIGTKVRYIRLSGNARNIIFLITVIILLATVILGRRVAGAKRWIGFIQPAEVAKLSLIFWLAGFFARSQHPENGFKKQVLPPLAVTLVIIALTIIQPAVGTSLILFVTSMTMFFLGGVRMKYLLIIGMIAIVGFLVLIFVFPHSRYRIINFWQGDRYQQEQSRIGIGSGGLIGKGLGEGRQKFKFLPKLATDFIFAAVGEEFGFLGSVVLFLLFLIILDRGLKIAQSADDHFGFLLAGGITVMLFVYALIHIGVALGIVPPTGQPLPFVSYGGSALVTNLFALGQVLNVSKFGIRRASGISYNRGWYRGPYFPRARPW